MKQVSLLSFSFAVLLIISLCFLLGTNGECAIKSASHLRGGNQTTKEESSCDPTESSCTGLIGRHDTASNAALIKSNEYMFSLYELAKHNVLSKANNPIIIHHLYEENMVLLYKGERHSHKFVPQKYHDLKMVDHVLLSVFVLLDPFVFKENFYECKPIDDEGLQYTKDYRALLDPVDLSLETCCNFSETQLQTSYRIVRASMNFLDDVIGKKCVSGNELKAYSRSVSDDANNVVDDAVEIILNAMHSKIIEWKAMMSEQDWSKTRVVVHGPHMPRRQNLASQYYTRLFNGTMGREVIYVEALQEESAGIDLLATHYLDTAIGAYFWTDPGRMHYDLQAAATRRLLPQLLPRDTDQEEQGK